MNSEVDSTGWVEHSARSGITFCLRCSPKIEEQTVKFDPFEVRNRRFKMKMVSNGIRHIRVLNRHCIDFGFEFCLAFNLRAFFDIVRCQVSFCEPEVDPKESSLTSLPSN